MYHLLFEAIEDVLILSLVSVNMRQTIDNDLVSKLWCKTAKLHIRHYIL